MACRRVPKAAQDSLARFYDPTTAQFISRDPITTLTHEPYGYAGSNPLSNLDPTGLDEWDIRYSVEAEDWDGSGTRSIAFREGRHLRRASAFRDNYGNFGEKHIDRRHVTGGLRNFASILVVDFFVMATLMHPDYIDGDAHESHIKHYMKCFGPPGRQYTIEVIVNTMTAPDGGLVGVKTIKRWD